ncbi:hypothetical protein BAZOLSSOX_2100 [uncultured Gammaproteobacteria bacterium]|nr:hypothetical protein BAZOLSSOX_2100 [uncultured Gammaproteobacteria bacterium]
MMRIYKIIKLHALSLLFVGSFNVLGTECKIKNEDLIYEITSSVYSYSNDTKTGTCKCKAGYKFRVDMISTSIQALIASRKDNLFTASFVKEGKKLQCATPKDDTELSPAAWTISISIFSVVAIGSLIKSIRSYYISRNTRNTDTIEMLDRNLLPRNQLQSVERNIYSKLDTSRTAPSNENTSADFSRNTNDNFDISEHTFVNSNVIEDTDVNSNLIENTGASGEPVYIDIGGDVHTPLNGGATGGPGDLPSATADAGLETSFPAPEGGYDEHIYISLDDLNDGATGGANDLPSTTADAGIRTAPPVPEREFREISSNMRGKCNIL